jgi:hypothetical protein
LVIPVPRNYRNWICREVSKLDIKQKLYYPLTVLFVAISIAFLDSYNYLIQIWSIEEDDMKYRNYNSIEEAHLIKHLDKEKEYKTQRNLYLSGFALTLIFVIGRITDLMQEHADLEDELHKLQSNVPLVDSSTGEEGCDENIKEIEMKSMSLKKKE